MRIVAGTLKGRRLDGPTWEGLRPTSDSLRETLFNVLGPTLGGTHFLDIFAGTGAVGIEALSRGAVTASFVESDLRAAKLLQKNIAHVGVDAFCTIFRDDFMKRTTRALVDGHYDVVFLDPPYDMPQIESALERAVSMATTGGRVILEHSRRRTLPDAVAGATRYRVLAAGDSALSFYTVNERH